MTPFELPPQSPDERDRRLALLEAREEHRELDTLDADRAFEKTDRPAHAYARHSRTWLAQQLNHENAAARRSER
jgi:hypothetical protein